MEKSISDLFEKFLEIEAQSSLYNLIIGNIKIWQYVRFNICDKLLQELSGADYLRDNGGYLNHPKKQKGIQCQRL